MNGWNKLIYYSHGIFKLGKFALRRHLAQRILSVVIVRIPLEGLQLYQDYRRLSYIVFENS